MDVLILDCGEAIRGECELSGYENKIELLSYRHGVAQQITGDQSNTKRTSGKPNHQDFTVTKYRDSATSSLIDHCNQAKQIATVKVILGQNDNGKVTRIFEYDLTNALVSSISVEGSGDGKPQETVTFNYTRISWTHAAQESDVTNASATSARWNLATNKVE